MSGNNIKITMGHRIRAVLLAAVMAIAVCADDVPAPYHLPANATPENAHNVADNILIHRFMLALNEYWVSHPTNPEHSQGIDAKIATQRNKLEAADKAWREFMRAMKQAGY